MVDTIHQKAPGWGYLSIELSQHEQHSQKFVMYTENLDNFLMILLYL